MAELGRQPSFQNRLHHTASLLQRSLSTARDGFEEVNSIVELDDFRAVLEETQEQAPPPGGAALPVSPSEAQLAEEKRSASRLAAVAKALQDPANIVARDKAAFVFGVAEVALTFYWLGAWPSTYYKFWLAKAALLFTYRYFTYRAMGQHYLLGEYCYVANLFGAVQILFYPSSALLRKLAFTQMAGPLMWSIVAMRNSLVFHDLDRLTTLFMHSSPALTAWCMRWHPRAEWSEGLAGAELAAFTKATWWEMAVLPMGIYMAWALLYFLAVFVVFDRRIKSRGYPSMFTLMVEQKPKSGFSRFVKRWPPALQPLVYLSVHMTGAWLAILPTKIFWDSYWAHTLVLLVVGFICTMNGAGYYFKVFARKYMAGVEAAQAGGSRAKQA